MKVSLLANRKVSAIASVASFTGLKAATVFDKKAAKHVNKDFLYVVKQLSQIDQDHFPERMGATFILNAPGVFGLVWRIVRPWLDPVTQAKIHSIAERDDWRAQVRARLGGDVVENLAADVQLDGAVADPNLGLQATPRAVD